MDEVATFSAELLKHDPNSFDGHRLTADLDFFRAVEAVKIGKKTEGPAYLENCIKEYGTANGIMPNQFGVLMQLARAYAARQDFATAEGLYKRVLAAEPASQIAHTELVPA